MPDPHIPIEEAQADLRRFLHPSCPDQRFVWESPDPLPVDNCLCWHEYGGGAGMLQASLRYTLLNAAYQQPFSFLKRAALRLFGARIHPRSYLSPRVFIDTLFPTLLTIEEGVLVGLGARIALHEHAGNRFTAGRVTIRRGATIGAEAIIACGVEIGAFAVVGLGAVVLRDVPSGAIAVGNPARILRSSQ